jgi:hypothetical protein
MKCVIQWVIQFCLTFPVKVYFPFLALLASIHIPSRHLCAYCMLLFTHTHTHTQSLTHTHTHPGFINKAISFLLIVLKTVADGKIHEPFIPKQSSHIILNESIYFLIIILNFLILYNPFICYTFVAFLFSRYFFWVSV